MDTPADAPDVITRRAAVQRVAALLGGAAFVGGSGLLAACERADRPAAAANGGYQAVGPFSAADVALLDEVADTILPSTARSPGAKAVATGPFMALMVTDTYKARDQQIFRDGLRELDETMRKTIGKSFLDAAPAQRTALLEVLDQAQKRHTDDRDAKLKAAKQRLAPAVPNVQPGTAAAAGAKLGGKAADANLPDARQQNAGTGEVANAASVEDDPSVPPPHYFRMMKELACLGFFTSKAGYTQAMRYVEYPGRFDPCAPYKPGDKAWAPHA